MPIRFAKYAFRGRRNGAGRSRAASCHSHRPSFVLDWPAESLRSRGKPESGSVIGTDQAGQGPDGHPEWQGGRNGRTGSDGNPRAFVDADERRLDRLHHHRRDRRLDRGQNCQGRRLRVADEHRHGIVGALIGGFLLSFFLDTAGGGWWFTLFTAILGSVILLWLLGLVRSRT